MTHRLTLIVLSSALLVGQVASSARSVQDVPAPSPASAPVPFKVFAVYTEKGGRHTHYVPSGYMGDSDLSMSGAYTQGAQGEGPCLRVNYKATGVKGWSGIYWQDPANNWGDVPGRAGYDLRGATRLTFWARGENGGERIHEVRLGGIVGQFPDSDVATLSNIRLTKQWKQYTIDVSKKDLRHIIAGFGFSLLKAENPNGMTFYLNDILYEGPAGASVTSSTNVPPALVGRLPTETTAAAMVVPAIPPPTAVPTEVKDLEVKEVETGLKVSFSSRLMFLPGQAVLDPSSNRVLDQLITLLTTYPSNRVLIEGHTDNTGDKHLNLRLSELRAKAVRDYLIKHGGYDSSRFQITGYGDTKPIAPNTTKSGRSLNRRVEVTILRMK